LVANLVGNLVGRMVGLADLVGRMVNLAALGAQDVLVVLVAQVALADQRLPQAVLGGDQLWAARVMVPRVVPLVVLGWDLVESAVV